MVSVEAEPRASRIPVVDVLDPGEMVRTLEPRALI
jgi:hypothetical protein